MKIYKLLEIVWLVLGFLGSWLRSQNNLALENLALRQQLAIFKRGHPRPRISCVDREFWVLLRQIWSKWTNTLIIVKPDTVVKWHRQGFKLYWNAISRRGKRRGRPRVSIEIRELIHRIALENLSWRAPRIHGELLKLGFYVSERTISRYLPRREPDEDKITKWKAFSFLPGFLIQRAKSSELNVNINEVLLTLTYRLIIGEGQPADTAQDSTTFMACRYF